MKNEKDLRVVKTRANIRNAFMDLMRDKSLAEINVKEICDRALCSRNTFYLHYPYKEAVLEEITDECVKSIVRGTHAVVGSFEEITSDVVEQYAEGIMLNASAMRHQIGFLVDYGGSASFSLRLSNAIYESFIRNTELLRPEKMVDKELQFYFSYLASGVVSAILFWHHSPQVSDKEIIRMFRKIHAAATQVSLDHMS